MAQLAAWPLRQWAPGRYTPTHARHTPPDLQPGPWVSRFCTRTRTQYACDVPAVSPTARVPQDAPKGARGARGDKYRERDTSSFSNAIIAEADREGGVEAEGEGEGEEELGPRPLQLELHQLVLDFARCVGYVGVG